MPSCSNCDHAGTLHNWRIPPCSAPPHDCVAFHPKRLRGSCLQCLCTKYVPDTDKPKPVNPRIARLNFRRKR